MSALSLFKPSANPSDKAPEQLTKPQLRPTIILIHGGWQGPETYSSVVPLLEKAGYSAFAIALPSAGNIPATPDFSADVNIVRNAVTSTLAAGKDVVLVMHSWGAVVGCEALKGIKNDEARMAMASEVSLRIGKVVKLAFIAGLLSPEGKAPRDADRGEGPIPGFDCVGNLARCTDGPSRFFNDLPPDEALRWSARLKKHSRL
ncbi:MAG: hypothetical protein Q9181_005189 [Wetmoreana brouardii]